MKKVFSVLFLIIYTLILVGCNKRDINNELWSSIILDDAQEVFEQNRKGATIMTTKQQLDAELKALTVKPVNSEWKANFEVRDAFVYYNTSPSGWAIKVAGRWSIGWGTQADRDSFVRTQIVNAVNSYGIIHYYIINIE